MAVTTRNGNTLYTDQTGTLAIRNLKVTHVILTATAASAILALQDAETDNLKLNLRVAASGETQVFDFADNPILFPSGIEIGTATNVLATIVFMESRG